MTTYNLNNFLGIKNAVAALREGDSITSITLPFTPAEMEKANQELLALPADTDYESIPALAENVLDAIFED